MLGTQTKYYKTIKSPVNYIGGKSKILHLVLPLFPKEINQFVDLFVGGWNVLSVLQIVKFYVRI